jgi:hypothetical protein
MRKAVAGGDLRDDDEVVKETNGCLQLTAQDIHKGVQAIVSQWQKSVENDKDYVEK